MIIRSEWVNWIWLTWLVVKEPVGQKLKVSDWEKDQILTDLYLPFRMLSIDSPRLTVARLSLITVILNWPEYFSQLWAATLKLQLFVQWLRPSATIKKHWTLFILGKKLSMSRLQSMSMKYPRSLQLMVQRWKKPKKRYQNSELN